jgi:AcrR family transcriptional regulator
MGETKTKERIRRSKKEIESLIWAALERMVLRGGFNSVTLVGLAYEAGVEPPVIYNRFDDLNDLFNKYAQTNDLWLENTMEINPKLNVKENAKKMYSRLIDALYENEVMQRILVWELNDNFPVTRAIAQKREYANGFLLAYFNNGVKKEGNMDFNIICSLIISGIYYLVLHKNISTFCAVDFNKEESKEKLKKNVAYLVDNLFE